MGYSMPSHPGQEHAARKSEKKVANDRVHLRRNNKYMEGSSSHVKLQVTTYYYILHSEAGKLFLEKTGRAAPEKSSRRSKGYLFFLICVAQRSGICLFHSCTLTALKPYALFSSRPSREAKVPALSCSNCRRLATDPWGCSALSEPTAGIPSFQP